MSTSTTLENINFIFYFHFTEKLNTILIYEEADKYKSNVKRKALGVEIIYLINSIEKKPVKMLL